MSTWAITRACHHADEETRGIVGVHEYMMALMEVMCCCSEQG